MSPVAAVDLPAIAILAAAFLLILLIRLVAWRAVLAMAAGWPAVGHSRHWARLHPLRAWLERNFPKLFALLAARLRPDRFGGLPLTLFVLAALYLAGLLGGLTAEVMEAGAVLRFDRRINLALSPWRLPELVRVFQWITALGAGPSLFAASVVATAFLWADRRTSFIVPLWITFLGAQTTTWSSKYLIDRHRPSFIPGVSEASPSFPSGHATASMALLGFIAYALARELPALRGRFEVVFAAVCLIAAIAFSRIFLSVHFTTDVAAGLLVGLFWLLVGFAIRERSGSRRVG